MEDEALLTRCRRGDERAWECLVKRYERLVYSIPMNLGLGVDVAADVTQATFAALVSSIDRIDTPNRVGAWLSTVAKRESIRVMERRGRERSAQRGVPEHVDEERVHRVSADAEWLYQGLLLVSLRCRELLNELYFSQTTYESTSEKLGMPLGSLGPTRSRCLDSLRAALAKLYDSSR